MKPKHADLEIVMPVYNEEETFPLLLQQLDRACEKVREQASIRYLFVNDGSTDSTRSLLDAAHASRNDIRVVHLAHNFGHSAALACGLEHTRGDAAIFMDADLQDDPESVGALFAAWQRGGKTVVVERGARPESMGLLFKAFYFLLHKIAPKLPSLSFGTHCILDRVVIERLRLFQERNRYFPGLVSLASGEIQSIRMDRGKRAHGESRVGFRGLVQLAVTALVAFSATPIRIVSMIGLACSAGAFLSATVIIAVKIFTDRAIPGWASVMTVTLFASGIQSLCLGILGEYVARMYDEVRQRPLYFVETVREHNVVSKRHVA